MPLDKRQISLVAVGDSKTKGSEATYGNDWKLDLISIFSANGVVATMNMMAEAGWTTQNAKDAVDAWITANGSIPAPQYVLYTLGTNDDFRTVDEATWKANTAYIWDAFRTKWPNVQVKYVKVPLGSWTDLNEAVWLDDVASTRSWATSATGEGYLTCPLYLIGCPVFNVHENAAGAQLVAQQWWTDIGWLP